MIGLPHDIIGKIYAYCDISDICRSVNICKDITAAVLSDDFGNYISNSLMLPNVRIDLILVLIRNVVSAIYVSIYYNRLDLADYWWDQLPSEDNTICFTILSSAYRDKLEVDIFSDYLSTKTNINANDSHLQACCKYGNLNDSLKITNDYGSIIQYACMWDNTNIVKSCICKCNKSQRYVAIKRACKDGNNTMIDLIVPYIHNISDLLKAAIASDNLNSIKYVFTKYSNKSEIIDADTVEEFVIYNSDRVTDILWNALQREDDKIIRLVIEHKGIEELNYCFNSACSSNMQIVKVALRYHPSNLKEGIKNAQLAKRYDIANVISQELVTIVREKIKART